MKVFVFLKFNDKEIYSLLSEIRRVLNGGKNPSSHIHITVRGPFKEPRGENVLSGFLEALDGEPILISGVGKFPIGSKAIVYLKVNSPHLRKIWHKPDFPVKEYGFNPHITLFEGSPDDAERVYDFLRREDLSLLSHDYEIVQYASKNMELYKSEERSFSERDFAKRLGWLSFETSWETLINRNDIGKPFLINDKPWFRAVT